MPKLTPDQLRALAGQLEDLADDLSAFPKFIRRDCGSRSVHATVVDVLRKHGLEGNTALAEDILGLTEKLRRTVRDYYQNKFLGETGDEL